MDIIHYFLENNTNINNQNINGETPLILAIKQFEKKDNVINTNTIYKIIELLFVNNINVNICDNSGYSALMYCVKFITNYNEKEIIEIIRLLFKQNANKTIISNDGESCFSIAYNNKKIPVELMTYFINNESNITNHIPISNSNIISTIGDQCKKNNDINEMKKHYFLAIKLGNTNAKNNLFNYYVSINNHHLIKQQEFSFLSRYYCKIYSFALLYKCSFSHERNECSICLEDVDNIVKLPCHSEHKLCANCVTILKQKICPFCRKNFYTIENNFIKTQK
jgi:ankyrin repeat protein